LSLSTSQYSSQPPKAEPPNIDYIHILRNQTDGVFVLRNPISDLAVRE